MTDHEQRNRDYVTTRLEKSSPAHFEDTLARRHRKGSIWKVIFQISTVIGIIALATLILKIFNDTMGYAAIEYKNHPSTITNGSSAFDEMTCDELWPILAANVSENRLRTIERDTPREGLSQSDCYNLVLFEVAEPTAKKTWPLLASLLNFKEIQAITAEKYPDGDLEFRVWLTKSFILSPQSDDPLKAGIRTAILGSLFIIVIVILFSFPIGVAAAIYLEEYATQNRFNRIIQTNINNLAGVPSIIYGMLGLAVFVRFLEPITSGTLFGIGDPTTANGRTILSAGLTLSLLILPVIIINGQEAIRSVPNSLRQASYGMGASKWQTVWSHVLPNALPGILTGTILAVSRAFGETAPLVVVGAATFITFSPENIFSKFTSVPIQIYQWTARPQDAFQNIAAAAIIVLLVLLLVLNATAVLLRNRYSRRW
jgi:phosphate transport system permease protein